MRVATIDIGTNSVLLLVAECRTDGLVALLERATITRLGQGVDATRALAPEAVDRTLNCLADYAQQMHSLGVDQISTVATSAMRDARGGHTFLDRVNVLLGVMPRIITGQEEAALTFHGALIGIELDPGPRVVFDVGGGSTEIIVGHATGEIVHAVSLDVGSVRLTERHVRNDPPTTQEIDAMREHVRSALETVPTQQGDQAAQLVGVAGTVTTLCALVHKIAPYDGARIHGKTITAKEVAAITAHLAALPVSQRRNLAGMDPARADVIVGGAVVVEEVMQWLSRLSHPVTQLVVSDRGVRWGLANQLCKSYFA